MLSTTATGCLLLGGKPKPKPKPTVGLDGWTIDITPHYALGLADPPESRLSKVGPSEELEKKSKAREEEPPRFTFFNTHTRLQLLTFAPSLRLRRGWVRSILLRFSLIDEAAPLPEDVDSDDEAVVHQHSSPCLGRVLTPAAPRGVSGSCEWSQDTRVQVRPGF